MPERDEIERAIESYSRVHKNKIALNPDRQTPNRETSTTEGARIILRNANSEVLVVYARGANRDPVVSPRSRELQALAWARSMGYVIPKKPNRIANALITGLGILVYFLPGLLWSLFWMYREGQYKKAIAELVAKWVEAGSPPAGERGSVSAPKPQPQQEGGQNKSTEAKIAELCSLRDRELITPEEFENLRKEILAKLVQ